MNHCSYSTVSWLSCSSDTINPFLPANKELFNWIRRVTYGSSSGSKELQVTGKDKIVEKLK